MQPLSIALPHACRGTWLVVVIWACSAAPAARATPLAFDLPAQPASSALLAFAKQAGVEVLFSFEALKQVRSHAVAGNYEPAAAIALLLQGTGFTATQLASGKFIVTTVRASGDVCTLRGTVLANADGRAITGATVRVMGADRAASTNAAGAFAFEDLPVNSRMLAIQADGFVPVRLVSLVLRAGREMELEPVRLSAVDEAAQLGEIVVNANGLGGAGLQIFALQQMIVTPSRFAIEEERGTVAATLTESDLLALPQLGDDLYRAISHLPGLAADDMTARFWVRGAPHEQVLARLDGVDLVEPFHLKDTDSSLSILDLATISRLDLYTGGFSAEFGDRTAGVLAMETDRYVGAQPRTTLGLSLTGARAASRGQTPDGRSRWLVSARSGYPDVALKAVGTGNGSEIRPRYYDVMGKGETDLAPGQTLSVHALHAGDRMYFRDSAGSVLTSRYTSDYFWARWNGEFGRVAGESVLAYTDVSWQRDGSGAIDRVLPLDLHEHRELKTLGLRQDWTFNASDRALLRGGFEARSGRADYRYRSLRSYYVLNHAAVEIGRTTRDAQTDPDGRSLGAFFSARVQPWPELTLEPGVRHDGNDYARDSDVSPRFNAAWHRGRTTWRAAWGGYTQAQGLHRLAVQDGETNFQPAERAEHRVLSVEHRFRSGINLRLEGYERLVRRPQSHWENVVDTTDALPELDGDRVRIDPVRQRAQGLELIAERRANGPLAWSASYALARSDETLRNGTTIPRTRDQRHTFYLDATYTPNPRWQFSFAWQYHSGWPTTAWDFTYAPLANGGYAITSSLGPLGGLRLPNYARLDLRAQRRIAVTHGTVRVFLDVFNALGTTNTINYSYNVDVAADGRLTVTRKKGGSLFPMLPSVGATWDF